MLDQFFPVPTIIESIIERVKILNDELYSLGISNKRQIALARAMYITKDLREKRVDYNKRIKSKRKLYKLS